MANVPPVLDPGEQIDKTTNNVGQPQPTAMDKRVYANSAADTAPEEARTDQQSQAQETMDILASISDELATAAGQGQLAEGHSPNDESWDAFVAFCRDEAPTAGPTPPSPTSRAASHR